MDGYIGNRRLELFSSCCRFHLQTFVADSNRFRWKVDFKPFFASFFSYFKKNVTRLKYQKGVLGQCVPENCCKSNPHLRGTSLHMFDSLPLSPLSLSIPSSEHHSGEDYYQENPPVCCRHLPPLFLLLHPSPPLLTASASDSWVSPHIRDPRRCQGAEAEVTVRPSLAQAWPRPC